MCLKRLKLLRPRLALVPGLEGHKKCRAVTGANKTKQTETDETGNVFDARRIHQDFFHVGRDRRGAFERRPIRQLHIDVGVTLIFVRKKARWDSIGKKETRYAKDHQHHDHNDGLLEQYSAPTHIALCSSIEDAVKPIKESPEESMALGSRLEQQRRKRRAEGERIERGEQNGNRDRDRELLVEFAGDSGNESGGNKYGGENQGDADYGAGQFFHCFQGGALRRHALLDVALHTFDHNDGIVDHKTDRKHQTKERKRVDGKTEQRKKYECAQQRNRHRKQRNQRGAPALQEDENHEDNERKRDQKSCDDFLHALRDRTRGIQRKHVIQILRKALLHLRHQPIHAGGSIYRIRGRELIGGNDGARLAIETSSDAVVLRSQFDSSDIADPNSPPIGSLAHDNLPKFLRGDEPALREHGVSKFLALGRGFAARLPGWVNGVLRLNGVDDFRDGDAELRQGVGLYPQSHCILARSEYLNIADARRAQNGIDKVDVCVIGQKGGVVGPVRRVHGGQREGSSDRFSYVDTIIGDIDGKLGGSQRLAALRENVIGVGIGFGVEVHDQAGARIAGGIQRIHVVHVVHAAHLLFDGSGNRLLQGLRIRPNVSGQDLNLRRSDVRNLRDRQTQDGEGADKHEDDRDHHGHDGTIDKEL